MADLPAAKEAGYADKRRAFLDAAGCGIVIFGVREAGGARWDP